MALPGGGISWLPFGSGSSPLAFGWPTSFTSPTTQFKSRRTRAWPRLLTPPWRVLRSTGQATKSSVCKLSLYKNIHSHTLCIPTVSRTPTPRQPPLLRVTLPPSRVRVCVAFSFGGDIGTGSLSGKREYFSNPSASPLLVHSPSPVGFLPRLKESSKVEDGFLQVPSHAASGL